MVDLRSTNEVAVEGPAPLDALPGVRHAHHPVLREFLDVSDTAKAAGLTLEGLGITPDSLEAVAPQYLWRFRAAGQFQKKSA